MAYQVKISVNKTIGRDYEKIESATHFATKEVACSYAEEKYTVFKKLGYEGKIAISDENGEYVGATRF